MKLGALALVAAGAAALAAGCGSSTTQVPSSSKPVAATPGVAPAKHRGPFAGEQLVGRIDPFDFALRDQAGRRVRLSAQHGRLVLITFLYTHCTDICPLIAAQLNAAVREMYHQRTSVRVLAVSVDPVGDTRTAVHEYVVRHQLVPQFRYLTGTRAQLERVWQAYNVDVLARNSDSVAHSGFIFLLDRTGRPRVTYGAHATADQIAHDLRLLLRSAS